MGDFICGLKETLVSLEQSIGLKKTAYIPIDFVPWISRSTGQRVVIRTRAVF